MSNEIKIYCKNTDKHVYVPIGTSLLDLAKMLDIKMPYRIVSARVNYKARDLNFLLYRPKDVEFQDCSSQSGHRCYVRTLFMVLAKAVSEIEGCDLHVEHPCSRGIYCTIEGYDKPLAKEVIAQIKKRMEEIIEQDLKIESQEDQTSVVKELFAQRNSDRKTTLFDTLGEPYCRYFQMGDFIDYYNGVLMPSTGYINVFDLIPFAEGMLLRIPDTHNPNMLSEQIDQPKMFGIYDEFLSWNRLLGIKNVGEFNTIVSKKDQKTKDIIQVSEALQEKKIASIADMIAKRETGVPRFVLISGPSSSGKTTFSKRLTIQLMVNHLHPITLSMDNYFVNRVDTPKDENGEYDFEHINAIDHELFQQQLADLLAGKEVELPTYNFETGKREFRGKKISLPEKGILIIEGIHALNPRVWENLPKDAIFKIYVSAITTITLDNHNYIPTADTRLIRRIIRDYRYRNYSAQETIARTPSVRRGEERWIFPFEENADVMFNSALLFELGVLKKYAEPILAEVPKSCEEYTEAHRLLKFLSYFATIPERDIPPTSMLREFVGGSSFRY
ncbi:MAG: nucleoside kinase [Paludibacteraceae bacterium]|nr:nucleoside kinase [Paludibacteraceae bacterium]